MASKITIDIAPALHKKFKAKVLKGGTTITATLIAAIKQIVR